MTSVVIWTERESDDGEVRGRGRYAGALPGRRLVVEELKAARKEHYLVGKKKQKKYWRPNDIRRHLGPMWFVCGCLRCYPM
jgi:hypothetical protein